MHPADTFKCDELLEDPMLQTPEQSSVEPPPPRPRRPRVFKFPPRFPLISEQFYVIWTNHLKELMLAKPKVDDKPPQLYPELYLKPRRLDYFAKLIEENMRVNKDLLKRINFIQRCGGHVDCWNKSGSAKTNRLMCEQRQRMVQEVERKNVYIYRRLLVAKSEQPSACQLDVIWASTKQKLVLGSRLPFILFTQEKIDRGIKDPAFEKTSRAYRTQVVLEVVVDRGSKIGRVTVELFVDIAPKTCELFLNLIKGDSRGYAYSGTRIVRIVPGLYCCCGDVASDVGFGIYLPEGKTEADKPEHFQLNHSVPGVLSMYVNEHHEYTGMFNIIFKPLPQFNGKHVVFGRIKRGPAQFLERISAMGKKLGIPSADLIIRSCGWFTRNGVYHEGAKSTIDFPYRKKIFTKPKA